MNMKLGLFKVMNSFTRFFHSSETGKDVKGLHLIGKLSVMTSSIFSELSLRFGAETLWLSYTIQGVKASR